MLKEGEETSKTVLRECIEKGTNHNARISANQKGGACHDLPNQEILNAWFQRLTKQHYRMLCTAITRKLIQNDAQLNIAFIRGPFLLSFFWFETG